MMRHRWGRIINISSTAGNVGGARNGAYCAAKAGVLGLTRALALEVGEYNITVNAICPSWVEHRVRKNVDRNHREKRRGRYPGQNPRD